MGMRTEKILKPGQPGTKRWIKKYGSELICVRYKYDSKKKLKLTTVELIVENKVPVKKRTSVPYNKLLPIKVGFDELNLRRLVKAAGGRWDRTEKIWKLAYGEITALGLEDKIFIRQEKEK